MREKSICSFVLKSTFNHFQLEKYGLHFVENSALKFLEKSADKSWQISKTSCRRLNLRENIVTNNDKTFPQILQYGLQVRKKMCKLRWNFTLNIPDTFPRVYIRESNFKIQNAGRNCGRNSYNKRLAIECISQRFSMFAESPAIWHLILQLCVSREI